MRVEDCTGRRRGAGAKKGGDEAEDAADRDDGEENLNAGVEEDGREAVEGEAL